MEMSLPRNSAWAEERKGGRGRARHTRHGGQALWPPLKLMLCPRVPSVSPSPPIRPPGSWSPLPFPGFQGNPDVWAQLRHCSASLPCQMFPLPPGRGVCSPARDTGEGGWCSPLASITAGASPMSPVTHMEPVGSFPCLPSPPLGAAAGFGGALHPHQPGAMRDAGHGDTGVTWGATGQRHSWCGSTGVVPLPNGRRAVRAGGWERRGGGSGFRQWVCDVSSQLGAGSGARSAGAERHKPLPDARQKELGGGGQRPGGTGGICPLLRWQPGVPRMRGLCSCRVRGMRGPVLPPAPPAQQGTPAQTQS
ncbi:hypothetical protein Q9966_002038 [Columba livia]|nr:hypothetical protein Q9966_002038 [Columba livia]